VVAVFFDGEQDELTAGADARLVEEVLKG